MIPKSKHTMLDCIIVGDAFIDIILKTHVESIKSLQLNDLLNFPESRIVAGGSANVAVPMALLGGKVAVIGRVGRDSLGDEYKADLERNQIISQVDTHQSLATGLVVSIVSRNAERTMLVSRGANDSIDPPTVNNSLSKLGPSRFLCLSGYSLANQPQRDAILQAAIIGKNDDAEIVFDPGSTEIIDKFPDQTRTLVELSDIVCANRDETDALAGKMGYADYARSLSRNNKRVIVKLAEIGCLVAEDGETTSASGVPTKAVDSTGAG